MRAEIAQVERASVMFCIFVFGEQLADRCSCLLDIKINLQGASKKNLQIKYLGLILNNDQEVD